jgi:endonuclease/exonuclease/phosphatase family metal-dependent hydrolase
MKRFTGAAALVAILVFCARAIPAQTAASPATRVTHLRVLTINVWSGLDYEGIARFGEYETRARREQRFAILVEQVHALAPDIVFVQEANPVGTYAGRLARSLGLSEVHQVENAGVKIGPIGIPSNLKQGLAILARPSLRLRRQDVWKLSGPPGLLGDALSVHFSESVVSLVSTVVVNDATVYLVNVHLAAGASDDSSVAANFRATPEGRRLSDVEFATVVAGNQARNQRRVAEAQRLMRRIATLPKDAPVIIAGDFNADPETSQMRAVLSAAGTIDAWSVASSATRDGAGRPNVTWDAAANQNIAYSTRPVNAGGAPLRPGALLEAFDNSIGQRLDYIVLRAPFRPEDVASASIVLDKPVGGVHTSDHYGVIADIDCARVLADAPKDPTTVVTPKEFKKEFFPILMWDTDIGVGYGAKAFLLNPFGNAESFDLTAFNSSKGERWYRFAFSMPDFDTRQGKRYPLAVDVTLDYDKMIRNSFFGVGSTSRFDDRVRYTREPLVTSVAASHGFGTTVAQAGVKYVAVRNEPMDSAERQGPLPASLDLGRRSYLSTFGSIRYDSRDSYTNPSEGLVLQAEGELAHGGGAGGVKFRRVAAWIQSYSVLFYPKTVFALRIGGQSLFGNNLPVHVLLPLGGSNTLRGSLQDRYLDKSHIVMNGELRFPLVGRLGGVAGIDAGKVWPSLSKMDLKGWVTNPALGLRYDMKTFVVRMDIGLGRETTGFYFNFGHIF